MDNMSSDTHIGIADPSNFTDEILTKGNFVRHSRTGYLPTEWVLSTKPASCTHRTFGWHGRLIAQTSCLVLVVNDTTREWWTFHKRSADITPIKTDEGTRTPKRKRKDTSIDIDTILSRY